MIIAYKQQINNWHTELLQEDSAIQSVWHFV